MIGAVVSSGTGKLATGDTLCDPRSPILLDAMTVPCAYLSRMHDRLESPRERRRLAETLARVVRAWSESSVRAGLGTGDPGLIDEIYAPTIGLVPIGAIGMTVFAIDLYFAASNVPPAVEPWSLASFLVQPHHWRVMADLALLALFAGIYSVPMYALIQLRSKPSHRARIIAANNILNALFMIASSILVGVLLQVGFSIPEVFFVVGVLNAIVAFHIFMIVPEYLLRFVAYVLTHVVYRLRVKGDDHIPTQGAAILVCNHVSFVDAVLLMAAG